MKQQQQRAKRIIPFLQHQFAKEQLLSTVAYISFVLTLSSYLYFTLLDKAALRKDLTATRQEIANLTTILQHSAKDQAETNRRLEETIALLTALRESRPATPPQIEADIPARKARLLAAMNAVELIRGKVSNTHGYIELAAACKEECDAVKHLEEIGHLDPAEVLIWKAHSEYREDLFAYPPGPKIAEEPDEPSEKPSGPDKSPANKSRSKKPSRAPKSLQK